jgi:hypothetical protein
MTLGLERPRKIVPVAKSGRPRTACVQSGSQVEESAKSILLITCHVESIAYVSPLPCKAGVIKPIEKVNLLIVVDDTERCARCGNHSRSGPRLNMRFRSQA